jgi:probable phosphoglycerate mutase
VSGPPTRRGGALLVRHGQSTWNAEQRWQGQADAPLSALGEHQAIAAAAAVLDLAPARVLSSDLARARRTAELLAPPDVAVEADDVWRERHAGEWTGLTRVEIEERYPGWLDEDRRPPGYEGDDAVLARALPALEALLDVPGAAASGGEPPIVLVVTHGGLIGTLERHLHAPWVRVPNLGGRWFHRGDGADDDGIVLGEREVLVDAETVTVPDQI